MRKGIILNNPKPVENADAGKPRLDTFDLLNLRLDSSKHRNEKGCGDSQLLSKPPRKVSFPEFPETVVRRSVKTQTFLKKTTSLDNFLLPPGRKNCDNACESKSSYPLSSAGDAGNFPFKVTPSGNLKVSSRQVVFESKKLSVLLANPENTRVKVCSESSSENGSQKKMAYGSGEFVKNSTMDAILSQAGISGLGSIIGETPIRSTNKVSSEYESKQTSEILDPELNLSRLGYTGNEPIEWSKVSLPDKKDLYLELCRRINNKKNTDCKIHIDREEFNCHLIVLQSYSDLFDDYIAVKKVEIPSEKCSAASFSFIYDWMVSEDKSYKYLNRENVLDVFNAAKYLKIKDLVEQCWAFVDNSDVFSEDTAFLLYVDAKVKSVEEVRELMIPRIQEFFLILVSSQDWLELAVDDVKNLLSSNYIRINCEMEVFMSAVRWLKYDWTNRDRYKCEVFNCVRFGNIAPWQLVDIKRNPENPEFMELAKDSGICKLIDDGLAFVIIKYWYGTENDDFQHWNSLLGLHEPPSRNWSGVDKTYFTYREFLIYLDQYRRNQLIEKSKPRLSSQDKKVGGANSAIPDEPVPSMEDFMSKKKVTPKKSRRYGCFINKDPPDNEELLNVKKMFTPSQNSLALWSLNRLSTSSLSPQPKELLQESTLYLPERETILVFGGVDPQLPFGKTTNTGDKVVQFMPDQNKWHQVATMPEPRSHHGVCFLKGLVYVVGGCDPRKPPRVVDSVWSFDPTDRAWYSENGLNKCRRNFGTIVYQKCIYVIGGCDDNFASLASVEKYNDEKKWKFVTPMRRARAGLACAKHRNHIWVAGGAEDVKNNVFLDTVEGYNAQTDQWTKIKRLKSPRAFSAMSVMADKLFLFGGAEYFGTSTCASVGDVDVWDATDMMWRTMAKLTVARQGHAVAYVGTQLFVIGGITSVYMKCLANVECFCSQRGIWVKGVSELPSAVSGHAAVTLPPAALISNV